MLATRNFKDARLHLERVLGKNPADSEALKTLRELEKTEPTPAIQRSGRVQPTLSGVVKAAIHLRHKGDIKESIRLLLDARERFAADPARGQLDIGLISSYMAEGSFEKAHDICLDVLRAEPDNRYGNSMIANIYMKAGLLAEARLHIERVLAIDPRDRHALVQVAELALAEGNRDQAEAGYAHLLELYRHDERFWPVLSRLGRRLSGETGRLAVEMRVPVVKVELPVTERVIDLAAAPEVEPSTVPVKPSPEDLLQGFRTAGLKQREPTRRQREFAKLHANDDLTRPAPLPQVSSAEEQLRLRIERNPRDVGAHFSLAGMLQRAGDEEGAVHHFRAVLAIDSKNSPAMQALRKLGRDIAG